jgi:hypothetical protein
MPVVHDEFDARALYRFREPRHYPTRFDINRREEFCAVYYPCEVPGSEDLSTYLNLKRALLFFDKVFVVVPEIVFSDYFCSWIDMSRIDEKLIHDTEKFQTQEYKLWRERFRRLRRFIDQTKIAHDAGVLIYVNPLQAEQWPTKTHFYSLPNVQQVPILEVDEHLAEIVFHSIRSDLNDASFRSLVKAGYPYDPNGLAVFKDQGEINWLHMLSGASQHDEDRMVHLATYWRGGWRGTVARAFGQYGHERAFGPDDMVAPPPGVSFDSIVSPVLGMAVLISQVMSFCIRNPVYPITDSQFHWTLLANKFKRIAGHEDIKRIPPDKKRQIGALGIDVLDIELPALDDVSFEDILSMRAKLGDNLREFRVALAKFADFSSTEFWSEEFAQECRDIATLKVSPAVQELRKALDQSRDKVILEAFKKVRTAQAAIPLVATFLAGIPPIYALAISAGLITAEAFLELYFSMKGIRAGNSLTFLLDVKRRL